MAETTPKMSRDYVIVGLKPLMNYVVACMTLFNAGNERVCLKARGRHISKAVDTVEMLRRVFLRDLVVEKIYLGTDVYTTPNGREASVSTIEIRLINS
jgi:DNA-binding protein